MPSIEQQVELVKTLVKEIRSNTADAYRRSVGEAQRLC